MLLTLRSFFFNKNISPTQLKASITVNAGCPGNLIAAFSCVGIKLLMLLILIFVLAVSGFAGVEPSPFRYQPPGMVTIPVDEVVVNIPILLH